MSNTLDEIRYKAIKFIQTVTAKNAQEPLSYLNDLLALITEARADERQAMLDALPEKVDGFSDVNKYDEAYQGFNQAIDQFESAIKLMGDK